MLNESLFKAVFPDLEQGLVQRRASMSSMEGNTFRDYAGIRVRPGSRLDPLNLHKAWARERLTEAVRAHRACSVDREGTGAL